MQHTRRLKTSDHIATRVSVSAQIGAHVPTCAKTGQQRIQDGAQTTPPGPHLHPYLPVGAILMIPL